MHCLIEIIVHHVPKLNHIRPHQLLISGTHTRSRRPGGLLAYIVPLKFRHGSPVEQRIRGQRRFHWMMLPHFAENREILYILYFLIPRFLNLSTREKIETVIHELYHIAPNFDGSLRQFHGRNRLHGNREDYDAQVRDLAHVFFNAPHDSSHYEFLKISARKHLLFQRIPEPKPKLLKVESIIKTRSTDFRSPIHNGIEAILA